MHVTVKALTTSETQLNSSVKTGKPLVSTFELIMMEYETVPWHTSALDVSPNPSTTR